MRRTVVSRLVSSTASTFGRTSRRANEQRCRRSLAVALQRKRFAESARKVDEGRMEGACRLVDGQKLFVGCTDRYNGVTVDSGLEDCRNRNFADCLGESLERWSRENKTTIWFRVHLSKADWIPALAKEGFRFHHAKEGYATMYKWLPTDIGSNVPAYAHTNLGVGGFVLDDETNEILIVKDKHSLLDGPTRWKLPGGIVDPGENIPEAVMREVREETGILTEFVSLVGFRHAHDYAFGCSDIYIVARLRPLTREIHKCEREIAECTWRKLEDYARDPNIVENNRIMAQAMLRYTKDRMGLELVEGEHPVTGKPVFIYTLPPE